jgi:cytoskeletal protein RodZ
VPPPRTSRPRPPAGTPPPDVPPRPEPVTPGEILRAARLRRRLSLADAERATRIRAQYLQALEDDEPSALPPGVYARGFLRNYAIFLGVPPDQVLHGAQSRRVRERPTTLRPAARPVSFKVPRATWLLALVALVAVLVVAGVAWLGLTAPEEQRAAARTGVTPTALVQLPPLATPVPPTPEPTTAPTPQPSPTTAPKGVDLELRTTDRSWVRATVDGKVVLETTLAAGQVQRWNGQQSVALFVGNAGGVDVTVNGQRIGALGASGSVIEREFTR